MPTWAWLVIAAMVVITVSLAVLFLTGRPSSTNNSATSDNGQTVPAAAPDGTPSGADEDPPDTPADDNRASDSADADSPNAAPANADSGDTAPADADIPNDSSTAASGGNPPPRTATAPTTGRIPSGTYAIPGGLSPGVYRAPGWTLMDAEGEVIGSDQAIDGTVLFVVREDSPAGSVRFRGGATRVEEDPIDPFQYLDGKYLVGTDIEPGTYRVTPATDPVGSLVLARYDEDFDPIQFELSLDPEDGETRTIEVLASDYAVYFEGVLEKID